MRKQKTILIVLAIFFFIGLGLITSGLASLPPAYEMSKTVIMNPNVNQLINDLNQPKITGDDTVTAKPAPAPKPENNKHAHVVRPGQTLAGILQSYGVDGVEAADATSTFDDEYRLKQLKAGDTLNIELFNYKGGKHIKSISYRPSVSKLVELGISKNGEFEAHTTDIKLEKVILKAKGEISGSFYQSTKDAGVTPSVISQLIAALSYDVDFQRDIQPGNKFTVLFEGMTGEKGEFVRSGKPLYVKLEMGKKVVEIYIVQLANGTLGYYHADGSNIKKALLRTPIDGARITSGFGMRMHPVLGYTKMHKGIDFGAPEGTPIYAAGDGVIETAAYTGGYGNFVLLRHTSNYETAYGHISRYGSGIHTGVHVRQGQIIAYVGMTGRATGPHLHYEIRINGTQVNPASVKLAIQNKLAGKELAKFLQQKKEIVTALSNAPTRSDLADLIKDEDDNDTTAATTPAASTAAQAQASATTPQNPVATAPAAVKTNAPAAQAKPVTQPSAKK